MKPISDDKTEMPRGPERAARHGYPSPYPRCAPVAVGSVPHTDPQAALDLIFALTPEVPAWPQLPKRSFYENMYVQFAEGLPGLIVDEEEERIYVSRQADDEDFIRLVERLETADPDAFALEEKRAAALSGFLEAVSEVSPPFVKGQVTGPVSFGLSVAFDDRRALLYDDTYRDVVGRLLAAKAAWQERLLARVAPGALPLIMFDEPYLTQLGSGFISLPGDTFEVLAQALRSVNGLRGIHVCGGTDWEKVAGLPLDVLNFDAADHLDSVAANAEAVGDFVREGGLLLWGAVPNDERAERMTPEDVGRTVVGGAELLGRAGGLAEDQILGAALVAPACGTGTLSEELAETCFRLAADASEWLRARL